MKILDFNHLSISQESKNMISYMTIQCISKPAFIWSNSLFMHKSSVDWLFVPINEPK
jgi:hypothetical protein